MTRWAGLARQAGPTEWNQAKPRRECCSCSEPSHVFRQLCREQCELRERSEQSDTVVGLYVCEMITPRGLVERDRKTLSMLQFD
jgi:hypothetical protein